MGAGNVSTSVYRFIGKIIGSNIYVAAILTYDIRKNWADYADDDIPSKYAIKQILPETPVASQYDPVRISQGTAIPFFISVAPYPLLTQNSELFTRLIGTNPQPRVDDIPIMESYDGSGNFLGWDIYGHDDGTGHFNEITEVVFPTFTTVNTGTGGTGTANTYTEDATTVGYDTATLNATYPAAVHGDIVYAIAVNEKYLKLDDSPSGKWDISTYNNA